MTVSVFHRLMILAAVLVLLTACGGSATPTPSGPTPDPIDTLINLIIDGTRAYPDAAARCAAGEAFAQNAVDILSTMLAHPLAVNFDAPTLEAIYNGGAVWDIRLMPSVGAHFLASFAGTDCPDGSSRPGASFVLNRTGDIWPAGGEAWRALWDEDRWKIVGWTAPGDGYALWQIVQEEGEWAVAFETEAPALATVSEMTGASLDPAGAINIDHTVRHSEPPCPFPPEFGYVATEEYWVMTFTVVDGVYVDVDSVRSDVAVFHAPDPNGSTSNAGFWQEFCLE